MSSSLKFNVGDMVSCWGRPRPSHQYGMVIEIREPRRDWRYKDRLPNAGICVMWSTGPNAGSISWTTYREVEKFE